MVERRSDLNKRDILGPGFTTISIHAVDECGNAKDGLVPTIGLTEAHIKLVCRLVDYQYAGSTGPNLLAHF